MPDGTMSPPLECGLDRGDRKEQVEHVVEERDETVFPVERLRLLIDGVHLHGMNAELLGQTGTALERIDQETHAPSLPLHALIHGQTG